MPISLPAFEKHIINVGFDLWHLHSNQHLFTMLMARRILLNMHDSHYNLYISHWLAIGYIIPLPHLNAHKHITKKRSNHFYKVKYLIFPRIYMFNLGVRFIYHNSTMKNPLYLNACRHIQGWKIGIIIFIEWNT